MYDCQQLADPRDTPKNHVDVEPTEPSVTVIRALHRYKNTRPVQRSEQVIKPDQTRPTSPRHCHQQKNAKIRNKIRLFSFFIFTSRYRFQGKKGKAQHESCRTRQIQVKPANGHIMIDQGKLLLLSCTVLNLQQPPPW